MKKNYLIISLSCFALPSILFFYSFTLRFGPSPLSFNLCPHILIHSYVLRAYKLISTLSNSPLTIFFPLTLTAVPHVHFLRPSCIAHYVQAHLICHVYFLSVTRSDERCRQITIFTAISNQSLLFRFQGVWLVEYVSVPYVWIICLASLYYTSVIF